MWSPRRREKREIASLLGGQRRTGPIKQVEDSKARRFYAPTSAKTLMVSSARSPVWRGTR